MGDEGDLVVQVTVADGRDPELVALDLWDRGATAVSFGPLLSSASPASAGSPVELEASFPTGQATRETVAGLHRAGESAALVTVDSGWRDEWRRHARPVEVVPGLVVAPAWQPVPILPGLVLEVDPGDCFGSGSHASTRLILGLLAASPPVGLDVLDVGTGSGILAVAAAGLGAREVVAVDIEPAAVPVTEANALRNGVAERVSVSTAAPSSLSESFDLALVNVTAGVHAGLGEAVARRVRPGGRLFLAGLLPGQVVHVLPAYPGCAVREEPVLDGWSGVVLERVRQ